MKTCTGCGLVNPDSSGGCECGGELVAGDVPVVVEGTVAGFWIRLGADLIDALVLGAIGWVIATVFRGGLLGLGERGVLLGIPLTLVYSGVLQSEIGGGQTLAKRLLRLRVLRLDGRYLSLDRSLVRWSIMGFVCYGGSVAYAVGSIAPTLQAQTIAAVLGGTQLAIFLGCALLVPFHPLKRGLHDLLTGSIVIRNGKVPAELVGRLHNPRRDRILVIGAASVAFLATAAGLLTSHKLPANLQAAEKVITAMRDMGLQNPGVLDSTVTGPNGTRRRIIATGYLPTNADGSAKVEYADDRILALLKKEMPLVGVDEIVVTLRRGINLGVYRSYETTNHSEPGLRATQRDSGFRKRSPVPALCSTKVPPGTTIRRDHVKTINVEHLPEPIARAVQAMVETLKVQLPPANAANNQPSKRIEFRRKPGRALTDLRRVDIYADVG